MSEWDEIKLARTRRAATAECSKRTFLKAVVLFDHVSSWSISENSSFPPWADSGMIVRSVRDHELCANVAVSSDAHHVYRQIKYLHTPPCFWISPIPYTALL